jgi:hypothetical protein
MNLQRHNNHELRRGQADQASEVYPLDLEDPPHPNEGGSVALLILIFVFLLGMLIGGCLR